MLIRLSNMASDFLDLCGSNNFNFQRRYDVYWIDTSLTYVIVCFWQDGILWSDLKDF